MADLTPYLYPTEYRMDEYWFAQQDKPGYTTGTIRASELGADCDRYLWYYSHGHAKKQKVPGRIARLFDDGHYLEDRIIKTLRGIGYKVYGEQKELIFPDGKSKGHIDGIVEGLPESSAPHLLECKTMNDKNFKQLQKRKEPEHKHSVQMQLYMGLLGLKDALYIVYNKNDSELYVQRVKFNKSFYDAQMARHQRILNAETPPQRISDRPEFYKCKMCELRNMCHGLTS